LQTLEEDLRQESLVHWWQIKSKFSHHPTPQREALLRRAVQRHLGKHRRKLWAEKRRGDIDASELPDEGPVVERPPEDVEMRMDIDRALATLPPLQQQICALLQAGHGPTEIAAELGITRNSVNYHIERIRISFRQQGLENI
jgi:RNA polymerase sigma factor (sigma-70 family)